VPQAIPGVYETQAPPVSVAARVWGSPEGPHPRPTDLGGADSACQPPC
jgi:hypothetical protein